MSDLTDGAVTPAGEQGHKVTLSKHEFTLIRVALICRLDRYNELIAAQPHNAAMWRERYEQVRELLIGKLALPPR